MAGEFDLIDRYFSPLAGPEGLGLLDDAACFHPPKGQDVIISKDVLVAGTHFFPNDDPHAIAQKALCVNLSDIAAKGAEPAFYFLGLALPSDIQETWFKSFSKGLEETQKRHHLTLAGGDTTSTRGPSIVSVTLIGTVSAGKMIRRRGAQLGDDVYVTGTLGDAALGLRTITESHMGYDFLKQRYYVPQPRLSVGIGLKNLATASADISDGLLADLGHICKASGVSAHVEQCLLPISEQAQQYLSIHPEISPDIWSGGDDYELVFTSPVKNQQKIKVLGDKCCVEITRIGSIKEGAGISLIDTSGKLVQARHRGYQHFR